MDPEHGKREAVHPDPEADRDRRRRGLAGELLPPAQAPEVVDGADRGRDRSAEQEPTRLSAEGEEGEGRDEDPEEERQPAEPRHRQPVEPPRLRPVDDAEQPRHPADRGGQQQDDHERENRAPDHLEVVGERVDHFVP